MNCRLELNVAEAVRYLGARPGDGAARLLVEEAYFHLRNQVQARHLLSYSPAETGEDGLTLRLADGTCFHSRKLVGHLAGCQGVLLLAATLGAGVDAAIRRLSLQRIALGAAAQAVGAALIESYCDQVVAEHRGLELPGLTLLPRFSPGYGDWNLEEQASLCRRLDTPRIGLTLTQGLMLAPTKSVTAVIGLRPTSLSEKALNHDCSACSQADCPYRR